MEVLPNVHRITSSVGERPLYIYLVQGRHPLLFDVGHAGTVDESILPYLASLGMEPTEVKFVVVSHPDFDHQGGLSRFRELAPDAVVMCGEADRALVADPEQLIAKRYRAYEPEHQIGYGEEVLAAIRGASGGAVEVDIGLAGGETIDLGGIALTVLRVPGHSVGHLALWWPERRLALTADAVQGDVYLSLDGAPALAPTYTHVNEYRRTIETLAALGAEHLLGCHWDMQSGADVEKFLALSRGYADALEARVLAAVDETPMPLTEIIATVNRALPRPWPHDLASELVYSVQGHVAALVADERFAIAARRPTALYQRVATAQPR